MFITRLALTFATSLIVASPSFASPPPFDTSTVSSIVQQLVFVVPLDEFIRAADDSRHDPRLDWSSDGCSAPVIHSTGRSFDFTRSCRRHDFAYRNYRRIDSGILWTAPLRRRVDEIFLRDMRGQCAIRRAYDRPMCNAWALVFFHTVRLTAGP